MTASTPRSLGDTLYSAWATSTHEAVDPCPVCFGRKRVEIRQGNGEWWAVKCGECSKGCEQPTGIARRREARVGVTKVEVSGIENVGDKFRYTCSPTVWDSIGLFETQEEAEAAAAEQLPIVTEHAEKAGAGLTHDRWESSTWSLGYHRAEIRRAKKSIAWHETQVEKLREASRERE